MLDFEILKKNETRLEVVTQMRSSKHLEGYTKIESSGNEVESKGVSFVLRKQSLMAFIRFTVAKELEQLAKKNGSMKISRVGKGNEVVLKIVRGGFVRKTIKLAKTWEDYTKIIGGLVRFIDDTDLNKSRCETRNFWKDFLDDEAPLK